MTDEAGNSRVQVKSAEDFAELLERLTGFTIAPSHYILDDISNLIGELGPVTTEMRAVRSGFYGRLNQKLFASRPILNAIYGQAAASGVTFNYPTKRALAWAVDSGDEGAFRSALDGVGVERSLVETLVDLFVPITSDETRRLLVEECAKPSKLRKAHGRDVLSDVVDSSVGPVVWSLWSARALHGFFGSLPVGSSYSSHFLEALRRVKPQLFDRRRSLVVRHIRAEDFLSGPFSDYTNLRDFSCEWLADEFAALDNHGFAVVVLHADALQGSVLAWRLSADLTLFAERFRQSKPAVGFFRPQWVADKTLQHNVDIAEEAAAFDTLTDGFTYRDLFVLTDGDLVRRLVLVLQKNDRDETLVPCPSCRSDNVRGNSYPTLGVKSWECCNALCPDRSIYNRGKRYSFKGLLAQAAIEDPRNEITVENVRRWQRDVLEFRGDAEINDTMIRHYSMVSDAVVLIDSPEAPGDCRDRTIDSSRPAASASNASMFWRDSPFFNRFLPAKPRPAVSADVRVPSLDPWEQIHGDALEVLRSYGDEVFDRAITSPPYFNARDYSQWPNLYCYLRDMFHVSNEVFRVLRAGGCYAFNIFDYFDNELIITHSAMGNKRIPLSALMADVFRRVGFEMLGAVVWDKGEIEGKRGFNAGNFSPFYQAPFNCWEHVIVVRKPGPPLGHAPRVGRVARIKPVMKMVRGKNTYGHTAPFPLELPARLMEGLPPGAVVLDPYGGSGTTARAALDAGLRCVLIERDESYCSLSARLISEHVSNSATVSLNTNHSRLLDLI